MATEQTVKNREDKIRRTQGRDNDYLKNPK